MTAHLAQVFAQAAQATGAAQSNPEASPGDAALTVNLQELLRLHGEASTAVILMLLSVFTVLPVAGVGTVLSLAIFALAWRWARHLETQSLPERIGQITLNPLWTRRCLHSLAWLYGRADRWLRPRWSALAHDRTRPWWALWIAVMGVLIFLPIPFGNVLPSMSLVMLSLGWMFRDGLAMLGSTLFGGSALLFAATFGNVLWQVLLKAQAWVVGLW